MKQNKGVQKFIHTYMANLFLSKLERNFNEKKLLRIISAEQTGCPYLKKYSLIHTLYQTYMSINYYLYMFVCVHFLPMRSMTMLIVKRYFYQVSL